MTIISENFYLIKCEFNDNSVLYFSEGQRAISGINALPLVMSLNNISSDGFSFELQQDDSISSILYWVGSMVTVYDVTVDASSLENEKIIFKGEILEQPSLQSNILSLNVTLPQLKDIYLPESKSINSSDYPLAPESVVGNYLPVIYGTVDDAELLPVQLPKVAYLAERANVGDTHIKVGSAKEFPSTGSFIIDEVTYSYSSHDDDTFYGVDVASPHEIGTATSEDITAIYAAAEHSVSDILYLNTTLSNDEISDKKLYDYSIDLEKSEVTFSRIPLVKIPSNIQNIDINFDNIDASSTAINGINAIAAATGTEVQSASILPTNIDDLEIGYIAFPEPSSQGGTNRIISGTYDVSFNVDVLAGIPQLGKTTVTIGGRIVWVWDGGQVVFDASGTSILYEDDVNFIPVQVILDGAQSNAFHVNVTSASRNIAVGNLDQSSYATLRKTNNTDFIANQTTDNPNYGDIRKAQLVIEHFSTSLDLDKVDVEWDNSKVGELSSQSDASGYQSNHTIEIDTISSGTAELVSTSLDNTLTSAFSRTDNAVSIPINIPVAYTVKRVAGSPLQTLVYPIDTSFALPENVEAGTYIFTVESNVPDGGIINTTEAAINGIVFNPNGGTQDVTVTLTQGQQTISCLHDTNFLFPQGEINTYAYPTITNIRGTVQAKPTSNAIDIQAEAVGGNITITDATSNVSGIQVAANIDGTGTGMLSVDIPAPARSVINSFSLPNITSWNDLTNKQLKLSYVGSDDIDVAIVRAYINVEYNSYIAVPGDRLTATVIGKSGNPADVLENLISMTGEAINQQSYNALKQWADTNSYSFSRRIDSKQNVSKLIATAAEQIAVDVTKVDGEIHFTKWDDTFGSTTVIDEKFFLNEPQISWRSSQDIQNDITLEYNLRRETPLTYELDSGDLSAGSIQSIDLIGKNSTIYEAGWIHDSSLAEYFLEQYDIRHGGFIRYINVDLPFTYSFLKEGDIVSFEAYSLSCRIINLETINGWISIEAEELPAS